MLGHCYRILSCTEEAQTVDWAIIANIYVVASVSRLVTFYVTNQISIWLVTCLKYVYAVLEHAYAVLEHLYAVLDQGGVTNQDFFMQNFWFPECVSAQACDCNDIRIHWLLYSYII